MRAEKKKEIISLGDEGSFCRDYGSTKCKSVRQVELMNSEDWIDILKTVKLSVDDIEELARNYEIAPVIDALEMMCKSVVDNNKFYKSIEKELEEMTGKYNELTDQLREEQIKTFNLRREVSKLKKTKVAMCFDDVSDISCLKTENFRPVKEGSFKGKVMVEREEEFWN